MRKLALVIMTLGLTALPVIGHTMETPSDPTLGDVLKNSGISISGYVDVSYTDLDITDANENATFTSGTFSRVFDFEDREFTLNQVAIFISKQPAEGFGGLVNLTLGEDADIISSVGTDGLFTTGNTDNFDLTQAFLSYAVGPFTVIAGKFVTASGAEVINTPVNPNLSRSILFGYAIPFSHTGLRATYKFGDSFSVFYGVNNGWDAVDDPNEGKTGELGLVAVPIPSLTLYLVGYSGTEEPAVGAVFAGRDTRTLIDFVATWALTDQLSLILNYDYAKQDNAIDGVAGAADAKWDGVAAYINYKFNDWWRVSLRGESFDDEDGFRTGVAQTWKEVSLTVGFAPASNFELLGEVRQDSSDRNSFADNAGVDDAQRSIALKGIYKF